MDKAGLEILVVDDEEAMREVLRFRLARWGFAVRVAADAAEAEQRFEERPADLLLSDVVLPGSDGVELLRALRRRQPTLAAVLITAHGSVDLAVEAMKQGALDFLEKPLDYDKLRLVLDAARQDVEMRRAQQAAARQLASDRGRYGELVGASAPMQEVYGLIREVAPTDAAVLITGESGTGKELVARTLHGESARRDGPFVAVNAAALPSELIESEIFGHEKGAFTGAAGVRRGCFELADGGTLLLDEIAEMPLALQPKLLRVLEDGRVRRLGSSVDLALDVRVLAATNRDPEESVQKRRLREDLFYRLNVVQIRLPPLRERPGDIRLLTLDLLDRLNAKHRTAVEGLRVEAQRCLDAYDWPGNVRELRNVIERAVVLTKGGWIEPRHLPAYLRDEGGRPRTVAIPVGTPIAEVEKKLILEALEQCDQNKAEAARRLGVDVKTIRNKLKRWSEGE